MNAHDFTFKAEWIERINGLNEEQRKVTIMAIYDYIVYGKLSDNNYVNFALSWIRDEIDRMKQARERREARRRERQKQKAEETTETSELSESPEHSEISENSEKTESSEPTEAYAPYATHDIHTHSHIGKKAPPQAGRA